MAALTLPPVRVAGDGGHLADHNLMRQAFVDLNTAKAEQSDLTTTNAAVAAATTNVANMSATVSTLNSRVGALRTVATTGSYTDLINQPTIPNSYTQSASDARYVQTINGVSPSSGAITLDPVTEILVLCPGDVKPLRASTTGASGLPRKWRSKTVPTAGGGYALDGDTWEYDGT